MTDVLMTYEEALKYLRTTKFTLDNLIVKEGMPYILKDGKYFFLKSEIDEWKGDRIIRP